MKFENQIILGDCLEIMKKLPNNTFDLCLTDPPYNAKKGFANDNLPETDYLDFMDEWIGLSVNKLKNNGSFYCFINEDYLFKLKPILDNYLIYKKLIVWYYEGFWGVFKKNYDNRSEFIYFYVKSEDYIFNELRENSSKSTMDRWKDKAESDGTILFENLPPFDRKRFKKENYDKSPRNIFRGARQGNVIQIPKVVRGSNPEFKYGRHPTQKPEKLIEKMILISSNKGDIILDPFCGSGTTCVVAKKLNRNFVGIELNPEYIKIASDRLKNPINFPKEKKIIPKNPISL